MLNILPPASTSSPIFFYQRHEKAILNFPRLIGYKALRNVTGTLQEMHERFLPTSANLTHLSPLGEVLQGGGFYAYTP